MLGRSTFYTRDVYISERMGDASETQLQGFFFLFFDMTRFEAN